MSRAQFLRSRPFPWWRQLHHWIPIGLVGAGDFKAATSGTPSAPITLCGPRSAVLEGDGISSGYTFYLDHASWWRVEDFTVEGGQKGVMTDYATHDLLYGLYVHGTGDEASSASPPLPALPPELARFAVRRQQPAENND